MPVMSLLRAAQPKSAAILALSNKTGLQNVLRKFGTSGAKSGGGGGDHTIPVMPSRFQWNKYKDLLHFYLMLGLIPVTCVVFYANVFIGPSTLAEIPEGYEPKQYEYHKHPITRWMCKHLQRNYQEGYERNIHYLVEEDKMRRMRMLSKRVDELMRQRGDYPNYYTNRHNMSKYVRVSQTHRELVNDHSGEE